VGRMPGAGRDCFLSAVSAQPHPIPNRTVPPPPFLSPRLPACLCVFLGGVRMPVCLCSKPGLPNPRQSISAYGSGGGGEGEPSEPGTRGKQRSTGE
jgi:hypothetical protein